MDKSFAIRRLKRMASYKRRIFLNLPTKAERMDALKDAMACDYAVAALLRTKFDVYK